MFDDGIPLPLEFEADDQSWHHNPDSDFSAEKAETSPIKIEHLCVFKSSIWKIF